MPKEEKCKCGNSTNKYSLCVITGKMTPYCEDCDPDPPVDDGHLCYICEQPSYKSTTLWGDVTVGICKRCDDSGDDGIFSNAKEQ